MSHETDERAGGDAAVAFPAVDDEPPLVWQRALHLAPPDGIGAARRAVFFALLCWLPIAAWALLTDRFGDPATSEALLQHYGVHVRCLVVIPLLIFGEASLHGAMLGLVPQFARTGLLDAAAQPRFVAAFADFRRWRDATIPWVLVFGAAIAWALVDPPEPQDDAMAWARDTGGGFGFGGTWAAYVVRPIFLALLLGWLWRIVLLVVLFARIGRSGLDLVPTHPDRAGGLGFVEKLPGALAPVTLALSAMLASRWAHDILHHGQTLGTLRMPAAAFVVGWTLLLLAPLLALAPALRAAKKKALPGYAALVAEQGRLVRRRWVEGTAKDEAPKLEPAGVGPIADAAVMYDAVKKMKSAPIGKTSLAGVLLPIAAVALGLAALQVPLKTLLLKVVKTLV